MGLRADSVWNLSQVNGLVMLPLLQLNFGELCRTGLDFSRVDGTDTDALSDAQIEAACRVCTGESYAYREEQLREEAVETGQNLDQLLSRELLHGFTFNPVKRRSLIWFGRRFGCVILTVCVAKGQLSPEWLYSVPGYLESGSDFVGRADRPYAYWDGHNLHRIYPNVQIKSPTGILICDFGNAFGWSLGETEPENVPAILANAPEYWEYSCVPSVHEEIVAVKGTRCVLLHSLYRNA
jgi:hypothetical protein